MSRVPNRFVLPRRTLRAASRLRSEAGFTIIELITTMGILLIVLGGISGIMVSGTRAEVDMNRRFQAQQEARIAVDKMRAEIHCASSLTLSSASSVTIVLPAECPTAGGSQQSIIYDTALVSTGRYRLRRAGVQIADFLTNGSTFAYVAPSASELGKLSVDLRVDLTPADTVAQWRLQADMVLRNAERA